MRFTLSFRVRLDVARATEPPDEPELHEHRDTEAVAELASPSPVGFTVPGPDLNP